jgi:hypothetical protein
MRLDEYGQWALVEQVFERGFSCATCLHKFTEVEPHGEISRYCGLMYLPISRHTSPEECQGYHQEQERLEASLRADLLDELAAAGAE